MDRVLGCIFIPRKEGRKEGRKEERVAFQMTFSIPLSSRKEGAQKSGWEKKRKKTNRRPPHFEDALSQLVKVSLDSSSFLSCRREFFAIFPFPAMGTERVAGGRRLRRTGERRSKTLKTYVPWARLNVQAQF